MERRGLSHQPREHSHTAATFYLSKKEEEKEPLERNRSVGIDLRQRKEELRGSRANGGAPDYVWKISANSGVPGQLGGVPGWNMGHPARRWGRWGTRPGGGAPGQFMGHPAGNMGHPAALNFQCKAGQKTEVLDFVSRYLPAYRAYLPTLYSEGPRDSNPEHLLVVELDEERKPILSS